MASGLPLTCGLARPDQRPTRAEFALPVVHPMTDRDKASPMCEEGKCTGYTEGVPIDVNDTYKRERTKT
jgi:hypothetical protein